ncbi:trehalose-phosphatase-domain-containing protein [Cunninghamella echinulata]|nr:trehalose-phosphatase-domain-containing protein [Cunninghamella echinulata]
MPSSFLHKRELFEQQMQQRQLIYCQQQNNTDESSLVKVLNQFIQDYPQWQQHIGITQTTSTKVNNSKNNNNNNNNNILENTHIPYLQQSMDQNNDNNNALLSKASIYIFMVNKQDQQKWLETISHSTQEVDLLSSSPPPVTSSSSSTCPPKYVIFIDANSNDLPPSPPLLPAQHYHTIHLQQVSQVPTLLNSILSRLVNKSMVNEPTFPNSLDLNNVIKSYNEAHQRLFLFDYDGTLTPIVSRPEMALPSASLLDYLNKLCKDPCNTVWIISGRDQKFLQDCFGHLHEVGLSAEHGSFMKLPGETHWVDMLENMSLDWKQQAIDIFMKYTNQLPGTEMEEKKSSITWHYRNALHPTAA